MVANQTKQSLCITWVKTTHSSLSPLTQGDRISVCVEQIAHSSLSPLTHGDGVSASVEKLLPKLLGARRQLQLEVGEHLFPVSQELLVASDAPRQQRYQQVNGGGGGGTTCSS